MDINFHYYAVKAIAAKAGFEEAEAQWIASYSQFVDDYDSSSSILLSEVPEFARHLATKIPYLGYLFSPVTTGFSNWFDMAKLTLETNQKWILTPFHFIPVKPIKELPNRRDWRVVPAKADNTSLIGNFLFVAGTMFKNISPFEFEERRINLIKIGMLLHTFADTYAHQNFSGYWGWENNSKLTKVVNNVNNADVTDSYSPNLFFQLPSVGHTNVNHAPDDSNVTFWMDEKKNENESNDNYTIHYTRSNTAEYLTVSKEILNFLLYCLNKSPINDTDWALFSAMLSKGFLTPLKDTKKLNEHWHSLFPNVTFSYDKDNQLNEMLEPCPEQLGEAEKIFVEALGVKPCLYITKSDYFFYYNVFANLIREEVNKEKYTDERFEAIMTELAAKAEILANNGYKVGVDDARKL